MSQKFELVSDFKPMGDQPQAIDQLIDGVKRGDKFQTLLGATGTGKTYTIAQVIERTQRPTLVICHNKTLAAQLATEFKEPPRFIGIHFFSPVALMMLTEIILGKETGDKAQGQRRTLFRRRKVCKFCADKID